jgi:hypothetical protein
MLLLCCLAHCRGAAFTRNNATHGAGLVVFNDATVGLVECLLQGNTAADLGGAIVCGEHAEVCMHHVPSLCRVGLCQATQGFTPECVHMVWSINAHTRAALWCFQALKGSNLSSSSNSAQQ